MDTTNILNGVSSYIVSHLPQLLTPTIGIFILVQVIREGCQIIFKQKNPPAWILFLSPFVIGQIYVWLFLVTLPWHIKVVTGLFYSALNIKLYDWFGKPMIARLKDKFKKQK